MIYDERRNAQIPFLLSVCEWFWELLEREFIMKRSDEKIGICVKFQKSFIRLRIVDLVDSTSSEKDLVVQVRLE